MGTVKRYAAGYILLAVLLVFLFVLNVGSGTIRMSVPEILGALAGNTANTPILRDIRLPRILSADLLGGALAVSGFLLQTFFNNPIAGPFVLGIYSGAKLIVTVVMITFLQAGMLLHSGAMILAAFLGSLISTGLVLLFSSRVHQMSQLVIAGVMVGYICSAATDFLVTFADDANIVNLHNWSMGSFSGISWENIRVMALVALPTLVLTFFLSKPIGAFQMGETYARNMGVNIRLFRVMLILLSSILSACVTAFAGPISFVGIAVPHLVKSGFRTAKPVVVIPACFLGGSVFCLFCDWVARTCFAPQELSISSVTALLGAPIVISIMLKKQKRG